jgi:hypothetical protein
MNINVAVIERSETLVKPPIRAFYGRHLYVRLNDSQRWTIRNVQFGLHIKLSGLRFWSKKLANKPDFSKQDHDITGKVSLSVCHAHENRLLEGF